MSEPAFTKGPWLGVTSGQNHRAVILSEDGAWYVADSTSPLSEAKANSRLILAAPALYEALVVLGDAFGVLADSGREVRISRELWTQFHQLAKPALALARGEKP